MKIKSIPPGLNQEVMTRLDHVFSEFPEIDKVFLYGSRAKGNHRLNSDIDLTVLGNRLTSSILAMVESRLDDLLLPQTIDLSDYTSLKNKALIDHIDRVGILIYHRS